ncbi:SUN domain-containing protein 2-like isoform X2 [Antennarius striatus]|uniref:SUN domain-containing protein 2-like isoform X2 n=1 Tax=Antennarius striatus TaxID=241820 RepID=UPI0035B2E7FC
MSRHSLGLQEGPLDRPPPSQQRLIQRGRGQLEECQVGVARCPAPPHGPADWLWLCCPRSLKLSSSCSESLLAGAARGGPPGATCGGPPSEASDTSLLSSLLLDDSCVQQSTLVGAFWGLDQDPDGRTLAPLMELPSPGGRGLAPRSVAESSTLQDSDLIGSDGGGPPVQTLSRTVYPHPGPEASPCCPASCVRGRGYLEPSTIYCRDHNRKPRPASSSQSREMKTSQRDPRGSGADSAPLAQPIGVRRKPRGLAPPTTSPWSWLASGDLLWSAALWTAGGVLRLSVRGAAALWPPTRSTAAALWTGTRTAGQRSADMCRWLNRRWCHMTPGDAAARLPVRRLLLLLPLLLLLLSPWQLAPAALQAVTTTGLASVYNYLSPGNQSAQAAVEEGRGSSEPPPGAEAAPGGVAPLLRAEQSLTALWQRVEAGGQRSEQRHRQLVALYARLHARVRLLDPTRPEDQEAPPADAPLADAPSGWHHAAVGDSVSHDALLAEVARLAAALEEVRRDVEGVSLCRKACRRLDGLWQKVSEEVSSRVQEEVRTLIYGNQLTVGGGPPGDALEPLLQWLSRRYVSRAELQAELASLELRLLQNISLVTEHHCGDEDRRAAGGVTHEEVALQVRDALRRFSEDRTGRPDYALESAGGSVLTERCSPSYPSRAALLSLFGVPLWFYSQSPRAVIQPDVHPGNCWAFRGSRGLLVIRLSMRVSPSAVTLEHLPRALAPGGALLSAPRDFSVYVSALSPRCHGDGPANRCVFQGLEDEGGGQRKLLGSYRYDQGGEALQTFLVTEQWPRPFQVVEVQVTSNWGHPEFTCMYRFRVHGTPWTSDPPGPVTPQDQ